MSGMLPDFGPHNIEKMLEFGMGIVHAHGTLLYWLAGLLLVIFIFTYLINQLDRP